MKRLTENQQWVIQELRRRKMWWLAAATEENWRGGKTYYIDRRVNARGIQRAFNQGNEEAAQSSRG